MSRSDHFVREGIIAPRISYGADGGAMMLDLRIARARGMVSLQVLQRCAHRFLISATSVSVLFRVADSSYLGLHHTARFGRNTREASYVQIVSFNESS